MVPKEEALACKEAWIIDMQNRTDEILMTLPKEGMYNERIKYAYKEAMDAYARRWRQHETATCAPEPAALSSPPAALPSPSAALPSPPVALPSPPATRPLPAPRTSLSARPSPAPRTSLSSRPSPAPRHSLVGKSTSPVAGCIAILPTPILAVDPRPKVNEEATVVPEKVATVPETPIVPAPAISLVFQPFNVGSWFLLIFAFLASCACMYGIHRLNPYEARQVFGREGKCSEEDAKAFEPLNTFWFGYTTLMWQGYSSIPRSLAGKILIAFWFFFGVCVLVLYTVAMVAIYPSATAPTPVPQFTSLQQLVSAEQEFAVINGGSTEHRNNWAKRLVNQMHRTTTFCLRDVAHNLGTIYRASQAIL